MRGLDRWIATVGLAVVIVLRLPPFAAGIAQIVWSAALLAWCLTGLTARRRTQVKSTPSSPRDMVNAQLEAFVAAGFDEAQAKALLQESIRTAVRQQGGWKP